MPAGQTVQFQNLAQQAPNYATQSQLTSQAVDAATRERQQNIENQREAERFALEQERQAQASEMQKLQLAKLKEAQYEALQVPANTGIVSADQYINKASRNLVDMQSELVNQYKAGDLDADQFAAQSAQIKAQVPALKQANQTLSNFQSEYQKLLESGQISKADNGEAGRLWSAIQDGTISVEADESGQLMLQGTDPNLSPEEQISMPLSQINRIPKAIPKAPGLDQSAQGILAQMGDGPLDEQAVYKAMDNMFSNDTVENERLLKSIAVDQLGISLDKANEMLGTEVEGQGGATNALEAAVEGALMNSVKVQKEAADQKKKQAEIKQANDQLRNDTLKQGIYLKNREVIRQEETELENDMNKFNNDAANRWNQQKMFETIDSLQEVTPESLGSMLGVYAIEQKGKIGFKIGNKEIILPADNPALAKKILARELGGKDLGLQERAYSAPINRNNPFKRLTDWFSKLGN